jgi:hypothetical protein
MPTELPLSSFVRGALRRLPIETALIALAAVTAIHSIHAEDPGVWHARLLLTAVLALPLAFAVHERAPRHAIAGGAALAALAGLLTMLVLPDHGALYSPAARWATLLLPTAAYLVPFVVAAPRFSTFVRRFFEECTTWSLIGAVALVALAIVARTLEQLFELPTGRPMMDAMVLLTGGISLVVLDRLLPDRAAGGKVPELWRRLATAIGAPFVSLMMLILIAYELTVLVRGELPSNQLSPLLVASGFIGYLCTLIINAVAAEPVGTAALSPAEPHRFLRNRSVQLARAFPLALLLLLPMAIWALYVRIDQYGLTPFRVVRLAALLCLVVLGVIGSLRWLRRRAALGWHVPATIAAFAIPCALGPLSAVNLSLYSQAARADRLLTQAGVTTRHVAAPATVAARTISRERWYELIEALEQLHDLGGTAGVRRVLDGEITPCASTYGQRDCLRGLGLTPEGPQLPSYPRHHERAQKGPITVPAGRLTQLDFHDFVAASDVGQPSPAGIRAELDNVYLDCGDGWAAVSIAPLLTGDDPSAPLPDEALILHSVDGTGCANPGQLFVTTLGTVSDDDGRRPTRLSGLWIR